MQLQHVNMKLLVQNPGDVDLEALIPIFHNWIQVQPFPEKLLDVADYSHVPEGPGVVLIGYQGDYSVDNTDNRLGVRYNCKAVLGGENGDRLLHAARAALTASQRLEADSRLNGKLRVNGQEMEIFVNDRLLAPNTPETRECSRAEFDAFFHKFFGGNAYSLSYTSDPRKLFSVAVKAARAFSVSDLLANLNS
jgi:hypothetical protein